jgi:hypothetical protein
VGQEGGLSIFSEQVDYIIEQKYGYTSTPPDCDLFVTSKDKACIQELRELCINSRTNIMEHINLHLRLPHRDVGTSLAAHTYIFGIKQLAPFVWSQTDPKESPESHQNYSEYLDSDHWKQRRKEARIRAGNKCQLCGENHCQLQVHHNSYDNLGHEPDEDLIVLCDQCHAKHHEKEPAHTSHIGMVCPDCGAEWVVEIALIHRL